MEIEHCFFPDDLLYDLENYTWVRVVDDTENVVGITSLLSAVAGKLTGVRLRAPGTFVPRGRSLGTLESPKFVGPIPAPLSGTVISCNDLVRNKPKLLNDSPYEDGWLVRIKPARLGSEKDLLSRARDSKQMFTQRIAEFRARCFKAFPDHEMYEIGSECSAVLVRLNELIEAIPVGDVIHIVSDDPTSYVEMVRWRDQTGQALVEWREEGNLFHFIVMKKV